ncbi:NAD(P)H-dependent oxidoreductase [Chelativorans sp. Marseille-P2723]|uniref:NADPH-dependent FMN reductase n=1 Tax=Chelativorans sp. Marseille-P2723 TaxID=2709133 RepID=UPI00157141E2|nr:NAD(P)H-dependent oxidoreductase [Chelativorans sp. Marseille-P2723]
MPRSGQRPFVLGLGGTSRGGSSSERAMRVSLARAAEMGAETAVFSGEDMLLPMYSPAEIKRSPAAQRLIGLFRRADGIILASPAYHGTISGLLKNAIDYAEDLRSEPRIYWDGCAVGCICCAGGWQAAGQTLATLRAIVHSLRGWPTPMGVALNTSLPIFDAKGDLVDETARRQLELVGTQVVEFAMMRVRVRKEMNDG